jgi:hypothetical protein
MENLVKNGSDKFQAYLLVHKNDALSESMDGYYHADVVADAYSQGYIDGKKTGKQEFIASIIEKHKEVFSQKANQIYILTQNVVSFIRAQGYVVNSMHINLNYGNPRVIIAVPNDVLNDDVFVELAYTKIFENKQIFSKLFSDHMDIGLVASDHLDVSLLAQDGFGYAESFG